VRRLALAKVRELRELGLSYREIGLTFGDAAEGHETAAGTGFHVVPVDRLLRTTSVEARGDVLHFLSTLDLLEQGLAFIGFGGTFLYTNRVLRRILASHPERARIRDELHQLAETSTSVVGHPGPSSDGVANVATRELQLASERFSLKGSYIGLDLFGTGRSILVTLERIGPPPLSEATLRELGLTRKQADVTRLLVEGRTNAEIAETLCLSPHTVRHHVHNIFAKLGVGSRVELVSRLFRNSP
jgi:DNA-binding CsgD family transcriptional regulator